jgi:cellulose biosynthesis protein BcsQ
MKVLASYNIKGGVGKTATAVNLAYLAAEEGWRTLVWDLDPQGSTSFYFRVKPKVKKGAKVLVKHKRQLVDTIKGTDFERLDLIPADFSYRNLDIYLEETKNPDSHLTKLVAQLEPDYDFVFLDCAPGISRVSESVFHAADALLVPVIPTTLSLRTLTQLLRFREKTQLSELKVMPFFSLVDRRKSLHRAIIEHPPFKSRLILDTHIPYSSLVEQMGIHRAPLFSYAAGGSTAQAFRSLWDEIKQRLTS